MSNVRLEQHDLDLLLQAAAETIEAYQRDLESGRFRSSPALEDTYRKRIILLQEYGEFLKSKSAQ